MRRRGQQRPQQRLHRQLRSSSSRPGRRTAPLAPSVRVERLRRRLEHLLHGAGPARREDDAAAGQPQDRVLPDRVGEVLRDPPGEQVRRLVPVQPGRDGQAAVPSPAQVVATAAGGRAAYRCAHRAAPRAVYGSWSVKSGAAASRSIAARQRPSPAGPRGTRRGWPPPSPRARRRSPPAGRPGPARQPSSAAIRYARTAARHGVPAHDARPPLRRRAPPARPRVASASALSMPWSCSRWRERLPDVRQRAAVRAEVLVDHGVVHAGEAVARRSRRPGPPACTGATAGSGTAARRTAAPRARRAGPGRRSTSADANRQPTNRVSGTSTAVRSGGGSRSSRGPARSARPAAGGQVRSQLGPDSISSGGAVVRLDDVGGRWGRHRGSSCPSARGRSAPSGSDGAARQEPGDRGHRAPA